MVGGTVIGASLKNGEYLLNVHAALTYGRRLAGLPELKQG